MASERVTTRWTVERERAERDYVCHETFEVDVSGTFYWHGRAGGDDPCSEYELEIDRVRFRGDPFQMTDDERRELHDSWLEELRNGD